MKNFVFIALVLFSNLSIADGASHGGRHEIAIDGCCGSLRHVHNWNNEENRKLFFDFHNHEKFFSKLNSFSYVEYIDRTGKVLFHYPSPAYTKLWSYHDQIFVGMSDIKLYNPYQLVVWKRDGTILYKNHFSETVAELSAEKLLEFEKKHPEAYKFMGNFFFDYKGKTYCDFTYLGIPNQIGKEAWRFLYDISKPHPFVSSSESTSNLVMWIGDREPEIDREDGKLTIFPNKGDPIVIKLPK